MAGDGLEWFRKCSVVVDHTAVADQLLDEHPASSDRPRRDDGLCGRPRTPNWISQTERNFGDRILIARIQTRQPA